MSLWWTKERWMRSGSSTSINTWIVLRAKLRRRCIRQYCGRWKPVPTLSKFEDTIQHLKNNKAERRKWQLLYEICHKISVEIIQLIFMEITKYPFRNGTKFTIETVSWIYFNNSSSFTDFLLENFNWPVKGYLVIYMFCIYIKMN